jgi:Fe-S cluster assembly ATP-binding protein
MGVLEVKGLTLKIGGKKILDNLSIEFWEGHIHALIGPNGAGKSTLASTLMGLPGYRDYEGDIFINEKSIKALGVDERARLGLTLAWQEPARFEGLSVRDFIAAGAKDKKPGSIAFALEQVGLEPEKYLTRKVDKTLSGGERKRVELASIIVMEPSIVLLDEPDSGIDIEALEKIFETTRMLKERGATIIQITHSLAVLKQSEHAFLMCNGRIMDKGKVDRIAAYFTNKCLPCGHTNEPVGASLYE